MIVVPNALGDHGEDAEAFYAAALQSQQGTLDMSQVTFIRPYGLVALVCAARHYHQKTGKRLLLSQLQQRVHQYLERVDLFKVAGAYLQAEHDLNERWDRTQPKPKLLEITPISCQMDVFTVIAQAERIFRYWLHRRNLGNLLGVLSELCSNIYQHSGDPNGIVTIQTHEAVKKGQVRVRVAISDMGVGVRGSLEKRFGVLGDDPVDYLRFALAGNTSRETGRGGLGLRIVEQTVGAGGGHMWLRSETAALLTDGVGAVRTWHNLTNIPGTQVAVDFHAPLPD